LERPMATKNKLGAGARTAVGAGIALGAAAVILSSVSLSRLHDANKDRALLGSQVDSLRTATALIDSTQQESRKSDSLKFIEVDRVLGEINSATGELKRQGQTMASKVQKLDNRMAEANDSLSSMNLTMDGLMKKAGELARMDQALRDELDNVCQQGEYNGDAILSIVTYLQARDKIHEHNENRGGFLMFKGGKLEMMSYADFSRVQGKLSADGDFPSAAQVYSAWCAEQGKNAKAELL
jgi:hypothetical protein